MALPQSVTPADLNRAKYREGGVAGTVAVAVVNSDGSALGASGLLTIPYDYVAVTYPTATTEVYTTKSGGSSGSIQQVVTITYVDSTKASISSVARS